MARFLLILVTAAWLVPSPFVEAANYRSGFTNKSYELERYDGTHIILYASSQTYNGYERKDDTMTDVFPRIVAMLDDAHDYYSEVTGVSKGRITIAEIALPPTVSAHGMIAGDNIEIQPHTMEILCAGVASSNERWDQTLFYELGRNFYHFERALGEEFATAFAILMRFAVMEELGLAGNMMTVKPYEQPPRAVQFASFKEGWVKFPDVFAEQGNPRIVLNNAGLARLPDNTFGLGGGDLLASIIWTIATEYAESGGEGGKKAFLTRFFHEAGELGQSRRRGSWYMNLVACCEAGLEEKQALLPRFQRDWHWPRR